MLSTSQAVFAVQINFRYQQQQIQALKTELNTKTNFKKIFQRRTAVKHMKLENTPWLLLYMVATCFKQALTETHAFSKG